MKEVNIYRVMRAGKLFLGNVTEITGIVCPRPGSMVQPDIRYLLSLISDEEIAGVYPHLPDLLTGYRMKGRFWSCPVPPDGEPLSLKVYTDVLKRTLEAIKNGENVLVFCSEGMRRSRKFAETVLVLLGYPPHEAYTKVWDYPFAGSGKGNEPSSVFSGSPVCGDER